MGDAILTIGGVAALVLAGGLLAGLFVRRHEAGAK